MSKKILNKPLYKVNGKQIYYSNFLNALRKSGIRKGDTIFVHTSVSSFGKPYIFDDDSLLQTLVEALKESVGPQGTIIMPAFSYSFWKKKPYDIKNTKSEVGVLTEYFRKRPDVSRTSHPNHSAAIWGKHKDYLLQIGKDTFNKDSIFGKLHHLRGKIVFFGAPFSSCTYIHYIEQMHKIPYRYMREYRGIIINKGKEYEDEITVSYKYITFFTLLFELEKHLLEKGLLKEVKLGKGKILAIETDAFFKEGMNLLDKDVYFFLRNEPKIFRIFNKASYFFLRNEPKIFKVLDNIVSRFFE